MRKKKQEQTLELQKNSGDEHKKLIEYWVEKYHGMFSVKYDFKGGKDGAVIKRLLKTYGLETVKRMIDAMFQSNDQFYRTGGGYTLTVLSANSNKLAQSISRKDSVIDRFSEKGQRTVVNMAAVLNEREYLERKIKQNS